MARIYENGVKLNNMQVAEILMNEMPESHKNVICKYLSDTNENAKRNFAHAILDCYKLLDTSTPEEEKSKKYCKFLLDKYMKSSVTMDGEDSVMLLLINDIRKMGANNQA